MTIDSTMAPSDLDPKAGGRPGQTGETFGSARTAPSRRTGLVWPRLTWKLELATVGAMYLVYEATRALVVSRQAPAVAHGRDVADLERWAHIDPEVALNHFLNLWDPLADAAGYYYSTLHFVITPLVLIYLWWRHPDVYPRLRSALVMATAVALGIFIVWPVAPPRFTTPGITDTLVQHHIMGMSDPHGVTSLINQFAAMPSLHVGWAVWCAVGIVATSRSGWRHLAWLYPAATTFVVLATANHYLLDAVGGAALILVVVAVTPATRPAPMWVDILPPLAGVGRRSRTCQHRRRSAGIDLVAVSRAAPAADAPGRRHHSRASAACLDAPGEDRAG